MERIACEKSLRPSDALLQRTPAVRNIGTTTCSGPSCTRTFLFSFLGPVGRHLILGDWSLRPVWIYPVASSSALVVMNPRGWDQNGQPSCSSKYKRWRGVALDATDLVIEISKHRTQAMGKRRGEAALNRHEGAYVGSATVHWLECSDAKLQ
jgi:hypothetical protein